MNGLEAKLQLGPEGEELPRLGLTVRCIVEPKDGQWQAFSLEYGLAAQAESMEEAKCRLDRMIRSYVYDALVGEDRDHAHELLSRRATWRVYVRYYVSSVLSAFSAKSETYYDPLALVPEKCLV